MRRLGTAFWGIDVNKRELLHMGLPGGACLEVANRTLAKARQRGMKRARLHTEIRAIVKNPETFRGHALFGELAEAILAARAARASYRERADRAPYRQWGTDLDAAAVQQMENACRLPVSARGALMPDAHVGYGLPIGGVLGVRHAVIPYAVGVDIACRMKLTVLDLPLHALGGQRERLRKTLEEETRFGIGASFRKRREHEVLDADWDVSSVTQRNRDKAWSQLGTSGSGNHFVEFGVLTLPQADLGLEAGEYLALLSHSGSRGTGASVADHYSRLAMNLHPELPKELKHLAWLDLDSEPGQEYWQAMHLMGRYAAANHACIHRAISRRLGVDVLLDIENHHNFAWKEVHDDEEMVVHRKGATPAAAGVVGIIPGSMADPGYVVRGKGVADSLDSAAHGAGRRMSRKQAKEQFRWKQASAYLEERQVVLLSAGLDEVPMAYKNIDEVMAAQAELVEVVARFQPRLVKMAPEGERAED